MSYHDKKSLNTVLKRVPVIPMSMSKRDFGLH